MLNLEIGKTYKFTFFNNDKEQIAKVANKTIHDVKCHSYFITWPNPNSIHDFGKYIWDYGTANTDTMFVFNTEAIKTCEEVVEKLIAFDYEVVDNDGSYVMHTTINGKGRVARLKDSEVKPTKKKKKINKDTINIKEK